jgi:hypothetical protein
MKGILTKIFDRTLGETSDVVSKEIYSFLVKSGNHVSLRPEFTQAQQVSGIGLEKARHFALLKTKLIINGLEGKEIVEKGQLPGKSLTMRRIALGIAIVRCHCRSDHSYTLLQLVIFDLEVKYQQYKIGINKQAQPLNT